MINVVKARGCGETNREGEVEGEGILVISARLVL